MHHEPARAGRLDEEVVRVVQVVPQVAEEERLALSGEPERRVELRARPRRHDRLQELDVAGRHVHVDEEVRAREREEDVDALLLEQDRVEHRPPVAVVQHGTTNGVSSWPLTIFPTT